MDWNRVEGNWKQLKGKVKEQWGDFTDDDLDTINGRREQLKEKSRNATGIRRIRRNATWTLGITVRSGKFLAHHQRGARRRTASHQRHSPAARIRRS